MKKVSGIILAGGKSRRLGQDKALIRLGTRTLIEIVLEKLRCLTDDVILSTNEFDNFASLDVRMVPDIYSDRPLSLPGVSVLRRTNLQLYRR